MNKKEGKYEFKWLKMSYKSYIKKLVIINNFHDIQIYRSYKFF